MFSHFSKYFIIFLLFIILCSFGTIIEFQSVDSSNSLESNILCDYSNSEFIWPTPGYNTITSRFGYRKAPTSGAGTYHVGIDIGAPTGANIIASFSGKVTYIGFLGANGCTVRISNGTYMANYSHVSPHFLVYVGQEVTIGEVIATVGPKNVYGIPNNPYSDSNR